MRLQFPERAVEGVAGAAVRQQACSAFEVEPNFDLAAHRLQRCRHLGGAFLEVIDASRLPAPDGGAVAQGRHHQGDAVEHMARDPERDLQGNALDGDLKGQWPSAPDHALNSETQK